MTNHTCVRRLVRRARARGSHKGITLSLIFFDLDQRSHSCCWVGVVDKVHFGGLIPLTFPVTAYKDSQAHFLNFFTVSIEIEREKNRKLLSWLRPVETIVRKIQMPRLQSHCTHFKQGDALAE